MRTNRAKGRVREKVRSEPSAAAHNHISIGFSTYEYRGVARSVTTSTHTTRVRYPLLPQAGFTAARPRGSARKRSGRGRAGTSGPLRASEQACGRGATRVVRCNATSTRDGWWHRKYEQPQVRAAGAGGQRCGADSLCPASRMVRKVIVCTGGLAPTTL